jgi:Kef-type K+ transport system membrane component KefB
MTLPTHTQVPYDPPSLPILLSLSLYISLISFSSWFAARAIHAPLLGPLLIGILFGPVVAGLVPTSTQQVFIDIGYIALLVMVYEAGLGTDLQLLIRNLPLSILAALTGIFLPFALSFALLTSSAYGYTKMQAFAAGASLSSTSLGTTLALLTPDLRKTRTGCVLMCAALADDIVGLVIAGIIPGLADNTSSGVKVHWPTIVRPILVSVAFAVGTPMLAWMIRKVIKYNWAQLGRSWVPQFPVSWADPKIQLIIALLTLAAFVTATKYAGTSELFGAYLAGVGVGWVFGLDEDVDGREADKAEKETGNRGTGLENKETVSPNSDIRNPTTSPLLSPPQDAFATYIEPLLTPLLGPIFFASISAALPVGALFTTHRTVIQDGKLFLVLFHAVLSTFFLMDRYNYFYHFPCCRVARNNLLRSHDPCKIRRRWLDASLATCGRQKGISVFPTEESRFGLDIVSNCWESPIPPWGRKQ